MKNMANSNCNWILNMAANSSLIGTVAKSNNGVDIGGLPPKTLGTKLVNPNKKPKDKSGTIDVSGLDNNCGLFALSLATKLAIKNRDGLAAKLSKGIDEFLKTIEEDDLQKEKREDLNKLSKFSKFSKFSKLSKLSKHGRDLRIKLYDALRSDVALSFKAQRIEDFITCCTEFLEGKDLDRRGDRAPLFENSWKILTELRSKWSQCGDLNKLYDEVEKEHQNAIALKGSKDIQENQDLVLELRKKLQELSNISAIDSDNKYQKELEGNVDSLIGEHIEKINSKFRLNPIASISHLQLLINIARQEKSMSLGEKLSGILDKKLKQHFICELRKKHSALSETLLRDILHFALHKNTNSLNIRMKVPKETVLDSVRSLFALYGLTEDDKNTVYDNYCGYTRDRCEFLSADELQLLARHWNVDLTIKYPNAPFSFPTFNEETVMVVLSNKSRNHWQVEVDPRRDNNAENHNEIDECNSEELVPASLPENHPNLSEIHLDNENETFKDDDTESTVSEQPVMIDDNPVDVTSLKANIRQELLVEFANIRDQEKKQYSDTIGSKDSEISGLKTNNDCLKQRLKELENQMKDLTRKNETLQQDKAYFLKQVAVQTSAKDIVQGHLNSMIFQYNSLDNRTRAENARFSAAIIERDKTISHLQTLRLCGR